MIKVKCALAYILGIIGWLAGIVIGVVWQMLYGGYQDSNTIDVAMVLADNIAPAIVSVFLADYIFQIIFPEISSKKLNIIIFYIILFLNYGYLIYDSIATSHYTNFIYIATGVISLIYLINKLLKVDNYSGEKNGTN